MKIQMRFFAGLIIAGKLALAVGTARAFTIADVRNAWLAGDYDRVLTLGAEMRSSRTNQTAELDYLIGTSACKLGRGDLGRSYLAWCSDNYDITSEDKAKIAIAIANCEQAGAPERLTLAVARAGQVGVAWRLKTFSMAPKDAAIKEKLPETTRTVSQGELLARRMSLSQSNQALARAIKLAGTNFSGTTIGQFVIVGASGERTDDLGALAQKARTFYESEYGLFLPQSMVTIYLASSVSDLYNLAVSLHGFKLPGQCIGYSQQDDLSIVVVASGGTLCHELFHLMARSSFGDIPPWLDEGMAALYEGSEVTGNRLRGVDNWRGEVLRQAYGNQVPTLDKLIAMDWSTFSPPDPELQAANEATARYFLFYLQEQNKLASFFDAFRNRGPDNLKIADASSAKSAVAEDARRTLEKNMRQSIADTDQSFHTWLTKRLAR